MDDDDMQWYAGDITNTQFMTEKTKSAITFAFFSRNRYVKVDSPFADARFTRC